MTQFSSGKHAKLTADPEPFVDSVGTRWEPPKAWRDEVWAPRPEFDRPLTNPANPALAMFRQMHGRRSGADMEMAATAWASSLMQMSLAGSFTVHEAKHARAVLTHLAVLTQTEGAH